MKKCSLTLLFLSLFATFTAMAGNQFIPKDYSYEKVGSDGDEKFYVYFYSLFEYPDGISTKTDISKIDTISIATSSGNNSIIKLNAISAHMNQTRMQLTRIGKSKGETTFSVSITFNGETVTNTFPVKVFGLETSTIKSYILPDQTEPLIFDVIENSKFYNSDEKTTCTLTLNNADELKHGIAELIDGENGYKVIQYTPNGNSQEIMSDAIKYTITLSDGSESASDKIITYATRNCYATKILEYKPAAGQFRCEEAWDNPLEFFESSERGLSLGALGGYVVFGFDQPIYNNPQNPYGVDFTVEGNSFVAAEKGVWTEPGSVQVMEDTNGNGLPDDGEWYELAGSDYWLSTTKHNVELTYYNPSYNDRYTVPWAMKWEENGETHTEYGAVVTNSFHKHTFYPDYFYNQDNPDESKRWYSPNVSRDSITFSGISNIRGCIDMRSPSYIEFYSYSGFGYCDNKGFVKEDSRIAQNPYGRPSLGETAGDGMDISWAVDKNGNYVDLEKIDFVKVYTAGQVIAGWLGEWSTEVLNCAITLPDPEYIPQDYYYNYVGITQLQVPLGHTCQYEGFLFKNGRPVADVKQKWWLSMDKEGLVTEGVDAIATIDNTGFLTANGLGTVWVHFSGMDGIAEEVFEVSVCNISGVIISLEGNEGVDGETVSCVVGERIYINVESEDDNTESVNTTKSNRFIYDNYTWTNSNPEVGTIDQGNFIALKPGVTTLTVNSGINPSLSDQITITVSDIPKVNVLSIQIAKDAPKGDLLNSDLFSTENGATVYMENVISKKGLANVSLYNNHLSYDFIEGEYFTDILEIEGVCHGIKNTYNVPITYGPYNKATSKKVLLINSTDENGVDLGIAQLQGIDAETYQNKTFVDELVANTETTQFPTDNILSDGAYAYVTQGASLTRYDVGYGKSIASAVLSSTDKHQLAVYKDKLIASDDNSIKVMYRTDLESFKTIELNGVAKQMAINNDVAYILCATEEKAMINKLNLSTWTLTESNLELEGGNNASGMYFVNEKLYIASGEVNGEAASIVIFNPADNTSSVSVASLDGVLDVPQGVSMLAGNSIMVSRGAGFVEYNLDTESFGSEPVMMFSDATIPVAAVAESFESEGNTFERYYVAYSQGMAIFESSDLTQAKNTFNIIPTALNLMAATEANEAPTAKKAYSVTSGIYERYTSVKSCTSAKLSTYFSDTEGSTINNYSMYIREDVDWMNVEYASDGKVTPKVTFTGDVDDKTNFVFTLECIDKYGASAKTTATFTVTPRIYKPIISEGEFNVESADNDIVANISLANIFNNDKNSSSSISFTTVVDEVSDNLIISNAEIANDNLSITIPANAIGEATIKLTQTIKHKTYGTKDFSAIIPVVVSTPKASSISLNETEAEVEIGNQYTLVASILPANAATQNVVWTSSNEDIATVDNGVVTAIAEGETMISATTTDGSNISATCLIKVIPNHSGIEEIKLDCMVYTEGNTIVVNGASNDAIVNVYSASGSLVASKQATCGNTSINITDNDIYIVKFDDKVVKVVIK